MPPDTHPHDLGMHEAAQASNRAVGNPAIGRVDSSSRDLEEQFEGEVELRGHVGYLAGFISVFGVATLAWFSLTHLDGMKEPTTTYGEKFALAKLAAHAAISIAVVFYLGQMLRAAERMVLPYSWARNPLLASVVLGVKLPATAVRSLARRAAEAFIPAVVTTTTAAAVSSATQKKNGAEPPKN